MEKITDQQNDFTYYPSLDMYTLTGWISVAVGFLSLILFLPGVFQVLIPTQIVKTKNTLSNQVIGVFSVTHRGGASHWWKPS